MENTQPLERKSFLAKHAQLMVIILILIIIGLGGFFVYLQIDQSNRVATSLNQNISKINQNRLETTNLINQVINQTSQASESKDATEYKNSLNTASNQLTDLLERTNRTKTEIQDGPNTDTAEFGFQSKRLIEYRAEALVNFQNLITTSLCYNDKLSLVYNWVPEFDKQWGELNSNSSNQIVVDLATRTASKVDESELILPEVIDCFKTNFAELVGLDENKVLEQEIANYKNLSANLKKFASSITSLNQADYDSSSNEIKKISQNETVFQKTTKGIMDKAIEKYASNSEQKITAQELVLNQIIRNLKAKYRLDSEIKLF